MNVIIGRKPPRGLVYAPHDTLDSVSWMVFLSFTVEEWEDYTIAFSFLVQCHEPTCSDFGDPDFGQGTCPQSHANPRRRMKEE